MRPIVKALWLMVLFAIAIPTSLIVIGEIKGKAWPSQVEAMQKFPYAQHVLDHGEVMGVVSFAPPGVKAYAVKLGKAEGRVVYAQSLQEFKIGDKVRAETFEGMDPLGVSTCNVWVFRKGADSMARSPTQQKK